MVSSSSKLGIWKAPGAATEFDRSHSSERVRLLGDTADILSVERDLILGWTEALRQGKEGCERAREKKEQDEESSLLGRKAVTVAMVSMSASRSRLEYCLSICSAWN